MTQRAYRITLELSYTANGRTTSTDLADEIKRCERSFRNLLKERSARDVTVLVTAAEVED